MSNSTLKLKLSSGKTIEVTFKEVIELREELENFTKLLDPIYAEPVAMPTYTMSSIGSHDINYTADTFTTSSDYGK